MEYLVSMTTRVPAGTSEQAVADVRAREAAHSRELAAAGHLRRLWRPPLGPGEWRTLGLFAADGADQLDKVLTSMPLRIWRSDDVTPLAQHPNDPPESARAAPGSLPEFFTRFTVRIPESASRNEVDDMTAAEADRTRQWAGTGNLVRLWLLPSAPGETRALGLWFAADLGQLTEIIQSLPLLPWMAVDTTPLSPHPNDPASAAEPDLGPGSSGR